jgi:hypothetical protein
MEQIGIYKKVMLPKVKDETKEVAFITTLKPKNARD